MTLCVIAGALILFAFNSFPWGTLISSVGPSFPTIWASCSFPCGLYEDIILQWMHVKQFHLSYIFAFHWRTYALLLSSKCSIYNGCPLLHFVFFAVFELVYSKRNNMRILPSFLSVINHFRFPLCLFWLFGSSVLLIQLLKITPFLFLGITASHLRIVNVLSLSFRRLVIIFLLCCSVIIGFFVLLRNNECSWLCFSYLIAAAIYIVGSIIFGLSQATFCGFCLPIRAVWAHVCRSYGNSFGCWPC